MKAALLEEVGKLNVREVDRPACDPEGLVIAVAACAVCGTDVKVYHYGHRLIVPPRITGHELAGTIIEVGEKLERFAEGDRVAVAPAVPCMHCRYCRRGIFGMCDNLTAIGYHYDGGFAEYMAVPPEAVRGQCVSRIPETVSMEEAALAEPLACCINAQELAWVSLGQSVLLIGAGPVGCMNAQLARARGAAKVILADISDERLAISTPARADLLVNSAKEDLGQMVTAETDGVGADVVIVACSSARAQEQALSLVAKRGVVNFFGGLPKGDSTINFDSNLMHYREFYVVGNHGSSPRHNEQALALIESGKIDVASLITHRMGIDRIHEGIEITEKARGLRVLIKPEL